ncbi:MAG: membrane protein insertion efficiency factor YidD [Planctomycetes bacterium]|nr:membrane protein insertion efficiency factor YidD [Planctomycetota bacterium]
MKQVFSFAALLAIGFVRLYQVTLRPIMGGHCRFRPTCSEYAIASITKYGVCRGTLKSIYRILRCNPWGGCGYDPP